MNDLCGWTVDVGEVEVGCQRLAGHAGDHINAEAFRPVTVPWPQPAQSQPQEATTMENGWTMTMDKGVPAFPFVEDENANITGLGHQDKAAFAAEVNRYEEWCGGWLDEDGNAWTAGDIAHGYAVLDEDGERLHTTLAGSPVTQETPKAIAITSLWGQR